MWFLSAMFAARVGGQALQRWMPQPWLAPLADWQGSATPYWLLLTTQVLILWLMARTAWHVTRGSSVATRAKGRWLGWLGGLYMAGSLARIMVGLAVPAAPAWFSAWIPGAFHVVLAAFVLTLAHYHLRTAGDPDALQ